MSGGLPCCLSRALAFRSRSARPCRARPSGTVGRSFVREALADTQLAFVIVGVLDLVLEVIDFLEGLLYPGMDPAESGEAGNGHAIVVGVSLAARSSSREQEIVGCHTSCFVLVCFDSGLSAIVDVVLQHVSGSPALDAIGQASAVGIEVVVVTITAPVEGGGGGLARSVGTGGIPHVFLDATRLAHLSVVVLGIVAAPVRRQGRRKEDVLAGKAVGRRGRGRRFEFGTLDRRLEVIIGAGGGRVGQHIPHRDRWCVCVLVCVCVYT
mmetsp:Transcript_43040/g.89605  ORF Transcript_43040/g.89605 Transcript_43040/m.89605 type:complete len:267 (+) Transcript_43040:596-1396(+)